MASSPSSERTMMLSPMPKFRRGRAFVGTPPLSPVTPSPMKALTSAMKKIKLDALSPQSVQKSPSKKTTALGSPSRAKVQKTSPKKPIKSMKVMKKILKSKKGSASSSLKASKVLKKPSISSKASKFLKKPSIQKSPTWREKKDEFLDLMGDIEGDFRDVCGYNRSYRCGPPCSWTKFLGSIDLDQVLANRNSGIALETALFITRYIYVINKSIHTISHPYYCYYMIVSEPYFVYINN